MKPWWSVTLICGSMGVLINALALPFLVASMNASTEGSASSALKTIALVERDFRANDRDENGVHDFWTGDVSGLYSLRVKGRELRLISRSIAEADSGPIRGLCWPRRSDHGYFYSALEADDSNPDRPEPYYQDTGGNRPMGEVHHLNKFGFCGYPGSGSSRGATFIINEKNTMFRLIGAGHITRWPKYPQLLNREEL